MQQEVERHEARGGEDDRRCLGGRLGVDPGEGKQQQVEAPVEVGEAVMPQGGALEPVKGRHPGARKVLADQVRRLDVEQSIDSDGMGRAPVLHVPEDPHGQQRCRDRPQGARGGQDCSSIPQWLQGHLQA